MAKAEVVISAKKKAKSFKNSKKYMEGIDHLDGGKIKMVRRSPPPPPKLSDKELGKTFPSYRKEIKGTGVMTAKQEVSHNKRVDKEQKRLEKEWDQEERALKGKPKNASERASASVYKKRRKRKDKDWESLKEGNRRTKELLSKWSAPIPGESDTRVGSIIGKKAQARIQGTRDRLRGMQVASKNISDLRASSKTYEANQRKYDKRRRDLKKKAEAYGRREAKKNAKTPMQREIEAIAKRNKRLGYSPDAVRVRVKG